MVHCASTLEKTDITQLTSRSTGWAGARRELLDFMVQGGLTEADTWTIRLGTTPSGLTSAHLHHSPFFTGWIPFLPLNQQC